MVALVGLEVYQAVSSVDSCAHIAYRVMDALKSSSLRSFPILKELVATGRDDGEGVDRVSPGGDQEAHAGFLEPHSRNSLFMQ